MDKTQTDARISDMKAAIETVAAWIARCERAESLLAEIVAFEKAPNIAKWAGLMKKADAIVAGRGKL